MTKKKQYSYSERKAYWLGVGFAFGEKEDLNGALSSTKYGKNSDSFLNGCYAQSDKKNEKVIQNILKKGGRVKK